MNTEPAPQRTSKSPSSQDDWRSAASSRVESISFSIGDEQHGIDILAVRKIKSWCHDSGANRHRESKKPTKWVP